MEELMGSLPEKLKLVAEVLGLLCVVATVVVRLTPDPKDDEKAGKIVDILLKVINYLPTIGVNPRTKKLEAVVKEYQEKENKQ